MFWEIMATRNCLRYRRVNSSQSWQYRTIDWQIIWPNIRQLRMFSRSCMVPGTSLETSRSFEDIRTSRGELESCALCWNFWGNWKRCHGILGITGNSVVKSQMFTVLPGFPWKWHHARSNAAVFASSCCSQTNPAGRNSPATPTSVID